MRRGAWPLALRLLSEPSWALPERHGRRVAWTARCQLQLGRYTEALTAVSEALKPQAQHTAAPELPYLQLLAARLLRLTGRTPQALDLLARWTGQCPDNPLFKLLLGEYACKALGDWALARRAWLPLQQLPSLSGEMAWQSIQRQLYCGALSAEALAREIRELADRRLSAATRTASEQTGSPGLGGAPRRPRLGLVSHFFRATPVYFLCIGALRELASEHDLVFYSRESLGDWATEAFRSIASEWHEVKALAPDALAQRLAEGQLDALIDLSGWLDPGAMRALGQRPVARQFKWVGGQSASTGSRAFDGFISDEHQSPTATQALYSEPLVLLPSGYATYTAPSYMPPPQRAPAEGAVPCVGVISHPMKVSPVFLFWLRQQLERHLQRQGGAMELHFVGWRYAQAPVQRRIAEALGLDAEQRFGPVLLRFVPTRGHLAQLQAVAALDWVVDTFPYTSGLTALEALALGVPLRTHAGQQFSARHGYSHARFAGLRDEQINLQALGAFGPSGLVKSGRSLLPEGCARRDHGRLARDLSRLLRAGRAEPRASAA